VTGGAGFDNARRAQPGDLPMETQSIHGLSVLFARRDRAAADLIARACADALRFVRDCWGLPRPRRIRVQVLTSWRDLAMGCTPRTSKAILACFSPLWYGSLQRLWRFSAGLTHGRAGDPAIGIKPPRLLAQTDRTVGSRIFVRHGGMRDRIRHAACHEVTHALAMRLRLPLWLNEGLAMLTTDGFCRRPTVRQDTLGLLKRRPRGTRPPSYLLLTGMDTDALVYSYVRGYWFTRFLEATRPAFLRGLLARRRRARTLHRQVAAELGMHPRELWRDIDGIVAAYFDQQMQRVRPERGP
jgi:hypothetical protein